MSSFTEPAASIAILKDMCNNDFPDAPISFLLMGTNFMDALTEIINHNNINSSNIEFDNVPKFVNEVLLCVGIKLSNPFDDFFDFTPSKSFSRLGQRGYGIGLGATPCKRHPVCYAN